MVVQTEQEPPTAGELIPCLAHATESPAPRPPGPAPRSADRRAHRLLIAGGFAPPYLELPYDGEVMQPLRESLERLLEAHEPNPALIVDGLWNLIETNRAASLREDFGNVTADLLDPGRVNPFERRETQAAVETFRRSASRNGQGAATR